MEVIAPQIEQKITKIGRCDQNKLQNYTVTMVFFWFVAHISVDFILKFVISGAGVYMYLNSDFCLQ